MSNTDPPTVINMTSSVSVDGDTLVVTTVPTKTPFIVTYTIKDGFGNTATAKRRVYVSAAGCLGTRGWLHHYLWRPCFECLICLRWM